MNADHRGDAATPPTDDTNDDTMDETIDGTVDDLVTVADRLDALADTADLMGDDDGATRLRADAARCRLQAMTRLDGREGAR